MKLLKRLLSIALTITCLATAPLWSGQTMRPEVAISELDNVQYLPQSAHNSQRDEYLVVWHNSGSGSRDIYGKQLDGSGNTLASFTITTGGVYLAQPTVAYDDINDQYLVVWIRDTFGDGSDWDLWGRLIPWDGPDGTLQEFSIDVKSSDQYSPTVAFALTQQEFFVVWNNDDGSSPIDVEGRRILLDGTFPPNSSVSIASGASHLANPDVAYNLARNEYLVTYDLNGADIMATRLTGEGVILGGGEFGIADWPDPESRPAVATCRGGIDQYFVVWQSLVGANDNDVYGRFVTGGGVVDGAPIHFDFTVIDEQRPDVICHTGLSEYLVVWEQQYNSTSGPFGIWGQRLTTSGELSESFAVRAPYGGETGVCIAPAVAAGEQGFLVGWEHERQGTSYQDIYGRLVTDGFFEDGFESGDTLEWSTTVP